MMPYSKINIGDIFGSPMKWTGMQGGQYENQKIILALQNQHAWAGYL